jgi:hypothetical protein
VAAAPRRSAGKANSSGRIVIDGRDGSLLTLSPFAIHGWCLTCHTDEVFFLDYLGPQAVFRSPSRGEAPVRRRRELAKSVRRG